MSKKNKILKFLAGIFLIGWALVPDPTDVTIVIPIALAGGGIKLIHDSLE